MAAYTTALLLSAINRRSSVPTGQLTYTEAELLAIADEEIKVTILPNILAVREEYFVFKKDFSITESQEEYPIPARAVGLMVREVQLVDSNNNAKDLRRKSPEEVLNYNSGTPSAFYLRGNSIILTPSPSATQNTLRITFFLRPSDLVTVEETAVISAINTSTNEVTVTTIPSTWATGDVFDLSRGTGGHECLDIDLTSTLVSGNVITLPSLPSGLVVGDYVSLAGESSLVQLIPDYQPILAQAVAHNILASMNQPGADATGRRLKEMLETAQRMIAPRVEGEAIVIKHKWF